MKAVIIFLLFVGFASAADDDPAEQIILKIVGKPFDSDLSLITPQHKAAVIDRLRQISNGKPETMIGTAVIDREFAELILIRLGDVPTIEKVTGIFERYNSQAAAESMPELLVGARQPLVIPSLARSLFVNDLASEGVVFGGDVVGPRRSTWAGVLITRAIRRCSEFAPELKKWAEEMEQLRADDPPRFGKVMKAWWKENADAFQRKDFAAVKPFREPSPEPSPKPPEPPKQPTLPEPTPVPPISAAPNVVAPPVTQPASAPASTGSVWSFIAIAAISVASLAALYFLWKRRA